MSFSIWRSVSLYWGEVSKSSYLGGVDSYLGGVFSFGGCTHIRGCHGYGEDPKAAQADRSSGGLCSRRAEQVCNQEGIGETRGRRQKAEVISRRSVRQDSQRQAGSEPGDQAENRWRVWCKHREQSGNE